MGFPAYLLIYGSVMKLRADDVAIEELKGIVEAQQVQMDENSRIIKEHVAKEDAFQKTMIERHDKLDKDLEPVIGLVNDAAAVKRISSRIKELSIWTTVTVTPIAGLAYGWSEITKHLK